MTMEDPRQLMREEILTSMKEVTIGNLFKLLEDKKKLKSDDKCWFGITGSWRKTSQEVEQAVRKAVREIIERNGGVVTGGALNVDWFATDEALKIDGKAKHIRVFLPVVLELYATHYRKRAKEGVITEEQAEQLIELLTRLKKANPNALIEHPENKVVDKTTYFQRNTEVVNASDAVIGFQVNDSEGVADTLVKAVQQGKPVSRLTYEID